MDIVLKLKIISMGFSTDKVSQSQVRATVGVLEEAIEEIERLRQQVGPVEAIGRQME